MAVQNNHNGLIKNWTAIPSDDIKDKHVQQHTKTH